MGPHGWVKEWCAETAHHSLTRPCGPKPRQWKASLMQSVFLRFIRTFLLFLFKSLCIILQDKTTRHLGIIFSKFFKKVFLIFFDKTHESIGLYSEKTTTNMPLFMTIMTFVGTQIQDLEQPVRVYSDWTRQPQFDGVKHNALDLEHMLVYVSMNACFCRPAACAARPGRLGVFQYARLRAFPISAVVRNDITLLYTDFPSGFTLAARGKSHTARSSEPAGSVPRG